jgi:amino-acid N-acetyltransferase
MNPTGANVTPIKPTDLRGILNYVPRFQGQVFIIALDGVIVADENLSNLLLDIAVLRSLQIKVVLVHGIGHQLKELSAVRQIAISDLDGAGVTDPPTLDLAIRASSRVSHQILEGLTQSGLKCAITNSVRAAPVGIVKGVDHQFSGKVDRIDTEFLQHLISEGVIPIIQPIGFDRDGHSLRINSDLLATELAGDMHATKIIFFGPHAGLEIRGEVRRQISVDQLEQLLQQTPDDLEPRQHSKATHAVRAIQAGVPRVHLVDGRVHDALLNEIFSNEGVGTLIYGNEYQQIRQATRRDTRLIYNLTRNAVRREELIHRTLQAVEKNIENFFVYEIDENLIACVALAFYADKPDVAEVGSLYVQPFHHRRGIGKKMVEFACLEAKRRGAKRVFALSTQAFTFFTSIAGFTETTKDALPEARRHLYDQSGRNPRVMVKEV